MPEGAHGMWIHSGSTGWALPAASGRKVLDLPQSEALEGDLFFSESGLLSISSVVLGHHMLHSTLCQSP